jgi:CheY-like chemotaxis protein
VAKPLVLVIEDHDDTREMYGTLLSSSGFDVELVAEASTGIKIALDLRPSAIVMDLTMSGLDGWSACRQLRSDPNTADVALIVVTGHVTAEDEQKATACGADVFLRKPVLPEILLAEIQRQLSTRTT